MKIKVKWKCVIFFTLLCVISTFGMFVQRHCNHAHPKPYEVPKTEDEWLAVAEEFNKVWNFPHVLGALDGKHVVLQAPFNSGSEYFNYKNTFSIVLFAVVDANYNFRFVDIGCQGRISDGGVFINTQLYRGLERKTLSLPKPSRLKQTGNEIPYFFIGDEAFALSENLMKVYPGQYPQGSKERIFNYRLCRARRIVENAFGIASSVFRVLRRPMLLEPEKAQLIIMAIVHLHNFLRRTPSSAAIYMPSNTFEFSENGEQTSLFPLKKVPRKSPLKAKEIRDELASYFIAEGKVDWQNDYA